MHLHATSGGGLMDKLGPEKWCPSCRMRFRLGPPARREFHLIVVPSATVSFLLSAAREFDETAERMTPGECFTAVDFIDWLRPTLRGEPGKPFSPQKVREAAGAAQRQRKVPA